MHDRDHLLKSSPHIAPVQVRLHRHDHVAVLGADDELLYRPELLDPSTPVGLGHINVALRIDRQRVRMGKFTELVARATEACEDLATGAIKYFHLFVAAVG